MTTQKNSNQQSSETSQIFPLRDYQREDVDFLKAYDCRACFNEQRTGKTPVSIRAMVERNVDKVIVICPASAIYPWASEYSAWSGKLATVVDGNHTLSKKRRTIANWKEGALIVSYRTVSSSLLQPLIDSSAEGIILDEAHRVKNPSRQTSKSIFKLGKGVKFKLALTGTPAPNKPQEVWGILHFLYPSHFKSYWKFLDEYFITVMQSNGRGGKYKDVMGLRPDKSAEFTRMLSKIATQRKRRDVMKWLPEKDYSKILLTPTLAQRKALEELQNYFETGDVVTQGVLDRLIRYRQVCLHPELLGIKSKSPKADWLHSYFDDYPDTPTIVFSKFTSFLHLLASELKVKCGMIVGSTGTKERAQLIKSFQSGKLNLLLINIDAGKEALTLDRAEAIIFTDKFPPVGDIEQAEDRFIATTEDKADKPHQIYELILKDTYDEELYQLIAERAESVDVINNFAKHMKGE